ncbi:CoA transferase subunit A [Sinanaerobacter chloroacetimidivorans]|jgi:acetate CoA/acetoacetate CoA-transferase alpha subunit|uniref:CoA transferase subunit A n=1 Tax=Sinanaerobacter chloroacetimidivorans TaxID=2818044 RepID=A0A8J8B196_9FIRM|nr:CoA transferase subunit A [Sinanaerobacter chloroacetimidivorans]MBR0598014.1 CoA transferase subunit A [Sinanaerobacter chloroacetimidivorans]
MVNKLISHKEAAGLIQNGQSIMVGGFGDAGYPFEMIKALHQSDLSHLTIMGNDGGCQGDPKGLFYTSGKVDKLIITYCGLNPDVSRQYTEGKLEIEFVPQGTFVERARCGGHGLGGFLTPTGVGTPVEEGKKILEVQGRKYLLEEPLRADVAIIKGAVADKFGNLMFHMVARNYNPLMAMAADLVIAEVDKIVEIGELDQNTIMLSGIFVDYIVDNRGDE